MTQRRTTIITADGAARVAVNPKRFCQRAGQANLSTPTWFATFLLLAADARASGILLPNGRCALVDAQLYADAMGC